MVKIAEAEAEKRGFSIGAEALEKATGICSEAVRRPEMGNGRFCRNLIENAILGYAMRNYSKDDRGADKNYALAVGDFTPPAYMKGPAKVPIGFQIS